MRVQLTTTAPVLVIVDTETGEVDQVCVMDEETGEWTAAHVNLHDENGRGFYGAREATADERAAAEEIAADADWPAWEFGL